MISEAAWRGAKATGENARLFRCGGVLGNYGEKTKPVPKVSSVSSSAASLGKTS